MLYTYLLFLKYVTGYSHGKQWLYYIATYLSLFQKRKKGGIPENDETVEVQCAQSKMASA